MDPFNPLSTTGFLVRLDGEQQTFLGTTFGFRTPLHFLTARHCVGDLDPSDVAVILPREPTPLRYPVKTIHRHPTADLALLTLRSDVVARPFMSTLEATLHQLGIEFFAYGYPENVLSAHVREPTARLFGGIVQRYFTNPSFMGYSYEAAEMSIPAPAGLSGGPVFHAHGPRRLIGVVTENFDSTTLLEAVEEINTRSEKRTIRHERMISYGLALVLHPLTGWLETYVPSAQAALEQQARADAEQQ